ncbi:hypothetical protein [Rickettsia endosymbiont of Orchestes rusci]|uniref:hypothetical protein n=1 Tax=Rickettsia endosymbiont of Orchestes rusci TaxID=3066250 RepID=UPI00313D9754
MGYPSRHGEAPLGAVAIQENTFKVILNLFQYLLHKEMLKQVQHDKKKSGFPPLARMTPFLWQFLIHATTPA